MRLGPQAYVDANNCPHVLARYINDCRNAKGHNVRFVKLPEDMKALVVAMRDIKPVSIFKSLTQRCVTALCVYS